MVFKISAEYLNTFMLKYAQFLKAVKEVGELKINKTNKTMWHILPFDDWSQTKCN